MKEKYSEFWNATWSCALGSIIGIVITFGTTVYMEYSARKDAERTSAMMVINNIERFCNKMADDINRIEREDSLAMAIWDYCPEHLDEIEEDTLQLFINVLLSRNSNIVDNTAEYIFSNNIDTWKNVSNRDFIENAGKCFSAKHDVMNILKELDEDKRKVWDVYWSEIYFAEQGKVLNKKQIVERIFSSPSICSFFVKQHMLYPSGLKAALTALREHNAKNKQMMGISDQELMMEFGADEKMKVYK